MSLKEQLYTILFSIIYGAISYIMFILNKRFILERNIFKKFIFNFIFILDSVLIYFIILRYLNDGILTYYSYLFIFLGIIILRTIIYKIKTYKK